jgi:hypothetical protein
MLSIISKTLLEKYHMVSSIRRSETVIFIYAESRKLVAMASRRKESGNFGQRVKTVKYAR